MNIENKILETYDFILEQRDLLEVMIKPSESSFPNLKFADRTKEDEINKALLDDIQTAANSIGVDVTIDFAKTGHSINAKSGKISRHTRNSAVDIDYIDGKVVSPGNKEIVNKFVDQLIKMGYNKNAEGPSNPKAVLTFGFPGHDNHVHVSNLTDVSSEPSSTDTSTDTSTSDVVSTPFEDESKVSTSKGVDTELLNIGKVIGKVLGLKEQSEFGRGASNVSGTILIPKDSNSKIQSPVDGEVSTSVYNSSCLNQLTIRMDNGDYLVYCGISELRVSNGQKISRGDILGKTTDDVEVVLYDSSDNRKNIDSSSSSSSRVVSSPLVNRSKKKRLEPIRDTDKKKKNKDVKYKETEYSKEGRYTDPLLAAIFQAPFSVFKNRTDKSGKIIQKRWGSPTEKRQVDPWIIDAIKKPFTSKKKDRNEEIEEDVKLKENLERIKKLLK